MKRVICLLMTGLMTALSLAACGGPATYQDGTYAAEFREYDSYGYKDFLRVTVKDGAVTEVVYNAHDANGALKTDDADYASRMASVQDTNPERYTADLQNQLLQAQSIEDVAVIAGATWSSECFMALYTALEANILAGDTAELVVDNVPER